MKTLAAEDDEKLILAKQAFQNTTQNNSGLNTAIEAYYNLCLLLMNTGNTDEILSFYEQLRSEFNHDSRLAGKTLEIANRWQGKRKYNSAISLYQAILDYWPLSGPAIKAQKGVIISCLQKGEIEEADKGVKIMLSEYRDDINLAFDAIQIADMYREVQEFTKARELYSEILKVWPNNELVFQARAGCVISAIGLKELSIAESESKVLITEYGNNHDNAKAFRQIADAYRLTTQYIEAIELYQWIISRWPDHAEAMWSLTGLAQAYMWKGDIEKSNQAVKVLFGVCLNQVEFPEAAYEIGGLYYQKGHLELIAKRKERANEYYQRALVIWDNIIQNYPETDNTANVYYSAGDIYRRKGEYGKARSFYQKVVHAWPESSLAPSAQYLIGICTDKICNQGGITIQDSRNQKIIAYGSLLHEYPDSFAAKAIMSSIPDPNTPVSEGGQQ